MYDQYYGFTGRPFQLTPDPHFYFESGTHRKAMSYLGYGLGQGEGFIVITGDVGAGKTTLVGHLMNTIDPNRLTAVKLVSTQVEGDDLLRLVAEQFGLAWEGESKAELLRSMEHYLREQARAGRRTLLIVDEGQNLAISALEELRMLSNFQLGGHSLLQIFLLGQPEFRQTLFHSPTLEQLRQRVIATHHLDPMEPEEVEPYILHRLGKVGWNGNPSFSPDAFEAIFDYSEGVPRKLNVLVSRLLLYGAVEQLSRINAAHVRDVVSEIDADRGIVETNVVPVSADAPAQGASAPEWPLAAAAPGAEGAAAAPFAPPETSPGDRTGAARPEAAPPSPGASGRGFAEARSLVAEQLGLGSSDTHHAAFPAESAAPGAGQAAREAAPSASDAQLAALESQIAALEARIADQDAALRRVLDLLIDWVERDPANAPDPTAAPMPQSWAAA